MYNRTCAYPSTRIVPSPLEQQPDISTSLVQYWYVTGETSNGPITAPTQTQNQKLENNLQGELSMGWRMCAGPINDLNWGISIKLNAVQLLISPVNLGTSEAWHNPPTPPGATVALAAKRQKQRIGGIPAPNMQLYLLLTFLPKTFPKKNTATCMFLLFRGRGWLRLAVLACITYYPPCQTQSANMRQHRFASVTTIMFELPNCDCWSSPRRNLPPAIFPVGSNASHADTAALAQDNAPWTELQCNFLSILHIYCCSCTYLLR